MKIKSEGKGILLTRRIRLYPLLPCGHSKQIITTGNERNDKYESSIQY
jgi:hypothetical protein